MAGHWRQPAAALSCHIVPNDTPAYRVGITAPQVWLDESARAPRRRFAVDGMDLMVAQAAEPTATMVATSPSRSASCSDGCSLDSGQGDDDDAWSDGA